MNVTDEALATLGLAAIIVEVRDNERERCAKIAERVANFRFDGEDRDLVLDIAKEIRNGL
jgi:hypothetical protein